MEKEKTKCVCGSRKALVRQKERICKAVWSDQEFLAVARNGIADTLLVVHMSSSFLLCGAHGETQPHTG